MQQENLRISPGICLPKTRDLNVLREKKTNPQWETVYKMTGFRLQKYGGGAIKEKQRNLCRSKETKKKRHENEM